MATSRVLSLQEINRALLSRQGLLERTPLPPADSAAARSATVMQTIEHLVGLQAQAPFPPYYGLLSRLDGFGPDDLAALITGRRVVRIALMRGVRAYVPLVQVPPRAVWGQAGQARHTSAEHWIDRSPQRAGDPAPVRLVAEFDNLVLSHADRSRVISTENAKRFYAVNAVCPGAVLIDGFVAASWRLSRSRDTAALTIEMFGPPAERAAVEREAERVLAFYAPGSSHGIRFAPLS